jgi:hypothetical protein
MDWLPYPNEAIALLGVCVVVMLHREDVFAYMFNCQSKDAKYSSIFGYFGYGLSYVITGGIIACMCLDLTKLLPDLWRCYAQR